MGLFSKKIEKQIASYQHELIETHYREVDNMYRQIRGWRHDYRNHIQTMKVLLANGEIEAVKEYLDKLDVDLNTIDTVVKTGNTMADAILNSKISLAKSKGIEVKVDAHIPVKLKMSELDLCVIIGNLFDNAIEACEKIETDHRWIRIDIQQKRAMVFLKVVNSFIEQPVKQTGLLFTTKDNSQLHGLGLMSMKMIVDKYNGVMDVAAKNGEYVVSISFFC